MGFLVTCDSVKLHGFITHIDAFFFYGLLIIVDSVKGNGLLNNHDLFVFDEFFMNIIIFCFWFIKIQNPFFAIVFI